MWFRIRFGMVNRFGEHLPSPREAGRRWRRIGRRRRRRVLPSEGQDAPGAGAALHTLLRLCATWSVLPPLHISVLCIPLASAFHLFSSPPLSLSPSSFSINTSYPYAGELLLAFSAFRLSASLALAPSLSLPLLLSAPAPFPELLPNPLSTHSLSDILTDVADVVAGGEVAHGRDHDRLVVLKQRHNPEQTAKKRTTEFAGGKEVGWVRKRGGEESRVTRITTMSRPKHLSTNQTVSSWPHPNCTSTLQIGKGTRRHCRQVV